MPSTSSKLSTAYEAGQAAAFAKFAGPYWDAAKAIGKTGLITGGIGAGLGGIEGYFEKKPRTDSRWKHVLQRAGERGLDTGLTGMLMHAPLAILSASQRGMPAREMREAPPQPPPRAARGSDLSALSQVPLEQVGTTRPAGGAPSTFRPMPARGTSEAPPAPTLAPTEVQDLGARFRNLDVHAGPQPNAPLEGWHAGQSIAPGEVQDPVARIRGLDVSAGPRGDFRGPPHYEAAWQATRDRMLQANGQVKRLNDAATQSGHNQELADLMGRFKKLEID